MTACMGLCEAFAAGVRKHPLLPYQPLFGRFCGVFEKAEFLRLVWVIQASRVKISYTNPLHLTSSMTHPKGWFTL